LAIVKKMKKVEQGGEGISFLETRGTGGSGRKEGREAGRRLAVFAPGVASVLWGGIAEVGPTTAMATYLYYDERTLQIGFTWVRIGEECWQV